MIFKNKGTAKLTEEQERLAVGISSSMMRLQRQFTDRLNARVNAMPVKVVKVALLLFCSLFALIFLYLIVTSLFFT